MKQVQMGDRADDDSWLADVMLALVQREKTQNCTRAIARCDGFQIEQFKTT